MKNKSEFISITSLILGVIFLSHSGMSQTTYLKITQKDKMSISYPPNTEFNLKTIQGYTVFKNSENPYVFEIDEHYTLTVFPTYKNESDVYHLEDGKIELILKSNHSKISNEDYLSYESYGVSLKSEVFDSKNLIGEKNARLEFSNGIIFNYEDGKFNATLDGEYIDIKGKYLIQSHLGVIKLSYSPKSGEIWWVFEPKT